MRTLIFDIETIGEDWDSLDRVTQDTLTRWIDISRKSSEEKLSEIQNLKDSLGLSPLTGKIIAIGLYDVELGKGAIYYTGVGSEEDSEVGDFILKQRNEFDLLTDFWEGVGDYDTFVSFNGRTFDAPFLLHRSVALGITPTKELMRYRYLSQQSAPFHIDLLDELTFYGAMHRKPSLHLFCRAFGINSPKTGGVTGSDIAELFYTKKYQDIARYNIRDVIAITALYKKWLNNLAPQTFLDIIDLY